jgi:hypothetical protein
VHRHSVAAIAAMLLISIASVSCGATESEPIPDLLPATTAELVGPWQPEPYLLDAATWSKAEAACRRDMQIGPGPRAVIVDARGEGVLTVRLVGVTSGGCNALQIKPDGSIVGAGGGWSGTGGDAGPAPEMRLVNEDQPNIGGGDLAVTGWSVIGRAGPGVFGVVVEPLGGHPLVRATLLNGWYAAWWPSLPGEDDPLGRGPGLQPHLPGKVVIRAYDGAGNQVDAIQP